MREKEILLNDFAIRCFRDTADRDYISARVAYRCRFVANFYWSSLQAIEKYFKCIFLLNRVVARDISHDLTKALAHTSKLPFPLELSESSFKIIEELNKFGRFRYLEASYYIHGPKLFELDKAVWEIRQYCRVLKYNITLDNGDKKCMLDFEIEATQNQIRNPSHSTLLFGGVIESILEKRGHPARKHLIWKNAFFSLKRINKVNVPSYFAATNAPLTLHPHILEEVAGYVFLPKDVISAYKEYREQMPGRVP